MATTRKQSALRAVRLPAKLAGMIDRLPTPVLLGGMMLFVIILSVLALSHQSLRLDEAQSLWQSSRTPTGILAFVAQDVHVPLYNLMLNVWQVFFGNGVETARAMSLVAYVATIPVVYVLGKSAYGRGVGLFGALLVTISPFMNWYGNEIKMYAQLTLLTVISQYFFLQIFRGKGGANWIGYTTVAAIGIYTHYFFAFNLITQAAFFLIKFRAFPKKSFRKFVLVALTLFGSLAPWLTYAYKSGAGAFFKPRLAEPTTVDLFNTYSQFLFGFQDDVINTLLVSLWPVSVLLGFLALRKTRHIPPETLYFFMAATVPIVAAFVISIVFSPFYLSRYLIIALPALYIFLGWVFSTYPPRLSLTLRSVLVVGILITLVQQTVSSTTPVKEDYQAATNYLAEKTSQQDVVVLSVPFTVYPVEYYYQGDARLTTLPDWNRQEYGPVPAFSEENMKKQVDKLSKDHQVAWVLLSFDQGYEKDVKEYFDNNFTRLEERVISPKMNLYAYQLRYDQSSEKQLSGRADLKQ